MINPSVSTKEEDQSYDLGVNIESQPIDAAPSVSFAINQLVVCSAHGVGRIVAIEEKEYAGVKATFYVMHFDNQFRNEKLTLSIPVNQVRSHGLRKLCSKMVVNTAFEMLSRPSKSVRGMWNRKAHEYEMKMGTGSVYLTAEVVRDLFAGSNDASRSYSERLIYDTALYRLSSEIAAVLEIDLQEAEQKILSILTESPSLNQVAKNTNTEDDFEDDDLAQYTQDETDESFVEDVDGTEAADEDEVAA